MFTLLLHITGAILHYPLRVSSPCPQRHIRLNATDWKLLDIPELDDPSSTDWNLHIRPANLIHDTEKDSVTIKLGRDSKEDKLFSAAYSRSADYKNGGIYEVCV